MTTLTKLTALSPLDGRYHGKVDALREKYGLTAEAALEKARPFLIAMEMKKPAGVRG